MQTVQWFTVQCVQKEGITFQGELTLSAYNRYVNNRYQYVAHYKDCAIVIPAFYPPHITRYILIQWRNMLDSRYANCTLDIVKY